MSNRQSSPAPTAVLIVTMLVAAAVLGARPRGAGAAEPVVTTDLLRLRTISAIDVAPDGSKTVFAVRSIGPAAAEAPDARRRDAFVNRSHLYLAHLGAGDRPPRPLTVGHRFDHSPAISPDGRRVAFVRARADDRAAPAQVWVMPTDGGEARPVTDLPRGARAPRWSPDGRRLLVTSPVPLHELPGTPPWADERPFRKWADAARDESIAARPDGSRAEVRAWLAENARDVDPGVISRLRFLDEERLKEPISFTQLFLIDPDRADADPDAPRLTNGFRDHEAAVFMPDGQSIVFVARADPDAHPDRALTRSLWRVGVDGRDERGVLAMDGWSLRHPRPSADGSVLAFLGRQTDEPTYRQARVGIASVTESGASEPVWLTEDETFDASVQALEWMESRSALVFSAPRRGGFPLMAMSVGLLEPTAIVDEVGGTPVGVHAFGVGGGAVVYTLTSPEQPCELRVRDARGDRRLLDLNPWVAERELSRPVAGAITRPDGRAIEYWLMEPTRRRPNESYPLVLEIHGGPGAMWGPGELTMWHEFQLLASWGYGVVYANPRGSGGYGYDFERANFQDWGNGPAGDVLAVVDRVALESWVDPDRLVVTGGSYGGYLTAWVITQDHRFKAAVAQRGVYDLPTFFGEGNAWQLVEWQHGGYPWEPRIRPILQRESPFTAVSRIRTPLLIMHGSRDLRTGVSQSEMLYRALKQIGRPVEYVRYPEAGHDLSRTGNPHQRLDRLNRMIDFFDRAVSNERPAPRLSAD